MRGREPDPIIIELLREQERKESNDPKDWEAELAKLRLRADELEEKLRCYNSTKQMAGRSLPTSLT